MAKRKLPTEETEGEDKKNEGERQEKPEESTVGDQPVQSGRKSESLISLKEYANSEAGPNTTLMAGFVQRMVEAGSYHDTLANFRKRYEAYKTEPIV